MNIDCIGCMHGAYPVLEGGDLLIITGDLTTNDSVKSWCDFFIWLSRQKYKKKIVIGGNHDNFLTQCIPTEEAKQLIGMGGDDFEYLYDNGTTYEGLKIWGSPWSLWFHGINPHCKAFTGSEGDLKRKYSLIPKDTNILITHTPPYGVLDDIEKGHQDKYTTFTGSVNLRYKLEEIKPKLHVFSHIHEHGGKQVLFKHEGPNTLCVNCSIMSENYEPVHKPVRIIL
jgi:Icc-related predicted phosphoesterase